MSVSFGGFAHSLTPMAFVRELSAAGSAGSSSSGSRRPGRPTCWPAPARCAGWSSRTSCSRGSGYAGTSPGRSRRARSSSRTTAISRSPAGSRPAGLGLPFTAVRSLLGSDLLPRTRTATSGFATTSSNRRSAAAESCCSRRSSPDVVVIHGHRGDSHGQRPGLGRDVGDRGAGAGRQDGAGHRRAARGLGATPGDARTTRSCRACSSRGSPRCPTARIRPGCTASTTPTTTTSGSTSRRAAIPERVRRVPRQRHRRRPPRVPPADRGAPAARAPARSPLRLPPRTERRRVAGVSATTEEMMVYTAARRDPGRERGLRRDRPADARRVPRQGHACARGQPALRVRGSLDPNPTHLALGVGDFRLMNAATSIRGLHYVLGLLQRGVIDVGFLGAAEVDVYGNINTTIIGGDYRHPGKRLPGSGGANDIASSARSTVIMCPHRPERLVERVQYVTSPGFLGGGDERERAGLVRRRAADDHHRPRRLPVRPRHEAGVRQLDPSGRRARRPSSSARASTSSSPTASPGRPSPTRRRRRGCSGRWIPNGVYLKRPQEAARG